MGVSERNEEEEMPSRIVYVTFTSGTRMRLAELTRGRRTPKRNAWTAYRTRRRRCPNRNPHLLRTRPSTDLRRQCTLRQSVRWWHNEVWRTHPAIRDRLREAAGLRRRELRLERRLHQQLYQELGPEPS